MKFLKPLIFLMLVGFVVGGFGQNNVKINPPFCWKDTNKLWWEAKPVLKLDSINIIKRGYSKIKFYESYLKDSVSYDKRPYGELKLKIENGKIVSSTWYGYRINNYKMNNRVITKDKIIETTQKPFHKQPIAQFRLTHFIDSLGYIYKTENKYNASESKCHNEIPQIFHIAHHHCRYNGGGKHKRPKYPR